MTPWIPNIERIRDSLDYVRARDTNRPLDQITNRTQYLYEQLEAATAGEVLLARNVILDSTTTVGMPVYFDATAAKFKAARADMNMTANDYGFAAETAEVRGIVVVKHTSTAGDIALVGKISSTFGISWASVIDDGNALPGMYYLDAVESGKITRSRSVLSVYIGVLDSSGTMLFHPEINGNLRSHLHQKFELEIDTGSTLSDPGWIPVAQFAGIGIPVPVGAIYGYNVSLNTTLAAYFPPVPTDAHWFEYAGRGVHKDAYVLDNNGLWWINTTAPDSLASDPNFTSGYTDYFNLWLTRINVGSSFVASLEGTTDVDKIPVVFTDGSGNEASTGALTAAITQSVIHSPTASTVDTAIKEIDGVTALSGPVVGKIIPGTGVAIEGSSGDETSGFYGDLVIHAGTTGGIELQPSVAAMDNATEEFYSDIPVLAFPSGRSSSLTLRVNIPTNMLTNRKVRLLLDIIGTTTTTGVVLTTTYKRIQAGTAIPSTFTALTLPTFNITSGLITRVTSAAMDANPGDTLVIKILQPASAPAYSIPMVATRAMVSAS